MNEARAIDELLRRNSTFAAFRLPSRPALAYVQDVPTLQPPHAGERCFVLAPFDPIDGRPMCVQPDRVITLGSDAFAWEEIASSPHTSNYLLEPNLDRAAYRDAVQHMVEVIRSGNLEKIVLARTIEADLQGITPGMLFEAAARAMPDAFIALARTDHFGLWLGASPETLLACRGDQVEADALAGTMPADRAPMNAADWGAKEREEQALVTRMITSTMGSAGVKDIRMEGPNVRIARSVAHLHTRVSGTISTIDALRLAAALHPTPAVGGTPRNDAMGLIRLTEWRDRLLYAGYWGPMDEHEADFFVNIRCMEISGERALLHVGAGITAGSDPESECQEVERKARTWIDIIESKRRAG